MPTRLVSASISPPNDSLDGTSRFHVRCACREGDLFGDEYFSVAVKDVLGIPFRTATVMSRTAPCELLVVPAR